MQIYQLFKDKGEQGAKVFEKLDKEAFTKLNAEGYGIYKSVNSFSATKEERKEAGAYSIRKKQFLDKLLFVYSDMDFAKEGDGKTQAEIDEMKSTMMLHLIEYCNPHHIIMTKNGIQPLRKIEEESVSDKTKEQYTKVIKGIIEWSKQYGSTGDGVFDTTRVLRVPGFNHMKAEPYPITFHKMENDKESYTLDELEILFPYTDKNDTMSSSMSTSREPNMSIQNVRVGGKDRKTGEASLQMQEVERIDIKEIVTKAYSSRGQSCEFDRTGRIVLDGRTTGNFQGKTGDRQFIASSSHDSSEGNKVTSVSKILGGSYSDAWKWIIDEFNIPSEIELKKKHVKTIEKRIETASKVQTFKESGGKVFSTGNHIIDADAGCFRAKNLILLHGPSRNGKTFITMGMANANGKPVNMGGFGHKVAFFSLEMDTASLKTQQASIRSGINRVMFQEETYTPEQRATYETFYKGFDKYFTIFDENDLGGDEGMTLESLCIQIEKLHKENGYDLFIIDSLKLIGGQNSRDNSRQSQIVKRMRKLKNSIPICIVLIHHNEKSGKTYSGSQDLENFVDWRIEVKKKLDPYADTDYNLSLPDDSPSKIFSQTWIRIHKERFGKEMEYIFDYISGRLRFKDKGSVEESIKEENAAETRKRAADKKEKDWTSKVQSVADKF